MRRGQMMTAAMEMLRMRVWREACCVDSGVGGVVVAILRGRSIVEKNKQKRYSSSR